MNRLGRKWSLSARPLQSKILTLCGRFLVISLFIGCGLVFKVVAISSESAEEPVFRSRHVLSSVEWETCDFEIGHARNYSNRDSWWAPNEAYGWLALYVFSILVIFVAIAIVCDDFFVPSLEAICEKLQLSEDVAGATFMAAGSSAPELFTSVAGVSVESDVGIGTIVGSAVFNLLVIIALTAALAGQVLQLDWRPLLRDSVCYALSIGFFTLFAWDGKFELYESVVLLVLYILYIVLMKFNSRLMNLLSAISSKGGQISPQETEVTQFVRSDMDSVTGQNTANTATTALEGRQGMPAGKLPPLGDTISQSAESGNRSNSHLLEPTASQNKKAGHENKGQLSRSFMNLSLGKSYQPPYSTVLPRLSVSVPMLTDCFDDLKTHKRSSIGFLHTHGPGEGIRLKSVAAQQVMREYRRRSDMLHQPTVVQVDANGNSRVLSADVATSHRTSGAVKGGNDPAEGGEGDVEDQQEEESKMRPCPCFPAVSAEFPQYPHGDGGVCAALKYILGWILFVISFPFICMFTWTIPDCSKPHNRKYFLASFFMAILWIAILSFAMVTLVGRSGCILSVDKFTMGLVVVAIGTSVPDCLSSILVARDGFGDMAVSNAIGSNVFDINLGLGLPFLIRSLIDKFNPIVLLTKHEEDLLDSGDILIVPHVKFGFILLIILLTALAIFGAMRFKLNSKVGVSFLFLYVAFVVYGYVQDLLCDYKC